MTTRVEGREPLRVTIKRMERRPGKRGHDAPEYIMPLDVKSAEELTAMLSREVHCFGYVKHGTTSKTMCGRGVVSGSVFGHAMFLRMRRAGLNTCQRCERLIYRHMGMTR